MVQDFVERVREALNKRRASYLEKLVACAAVDHDKIVGHIKGIDESLLAIRDEARKFLLREEAA